MFARSTTIAFLAWRNLTGERRRWLVSTVAIGVASMLVLFSQGVVRWVDDSSTAYLSHIPDRAVALEAGVNDFLLSQSTIPAQAVRRLRAVPGVAAVSPVLAVSNVLAGQPHPLPVFVIGYVPHGVGGPWTLSSGRYPDRPGDVVLDRGLASANGIAVGQRLTVLGRRVRVVGLSQDTNAAGIFFIFAPLRTVQAMVGKPFVSDVMLRLRSVSHPAAVIAAVDRIHSLHGLSIRRLIRNDNHMIQAGFSQPVEIIVVVCLLVGLLITTMVLYTATVEHTRDFALLKAIGLRPARLATVAVAQSLVLSGSGFLLGWALAAALTEALRAFYPVVDSYLQAGVLAEVAVFFLAVNTIALVLPLRFLSRVDPQEVFKA